MANNAFLGLSINVIQLFEVLLKTRNKTVWGKKNYLNSRYNPWKQASVLHIRQLFVILDSDWSILTLNGEIFPNIYC